MFVLHVVDFFSILFDEVQELEYVNVDCCRKDGPCGNFVFRGLRTAGDRGDRGMLVAGDLRGIGALPVTALEMFRESFGFATRVYMMNGWFATIDTNRVEDLD